MYIELQRTFRKLHATGMADDATTLTYGSDRLTWHELLQERRVVVLSEGGSGKTCELQAAVKRLRSEGKAAFFLRLDNVVDDFEDALVGDLDKFNTWLTSSEPGWLMLDSIDESRLRSPKDFERALRRVSTKLASAKDRVHVLVSGRPSAWRPQTDLDLCNDLFRLATGRFESPQRGEGINSYGVSEISATDAVFKVMALESLSEAQVHSFAAAKGVQDTRSFLEAIERGDAWSFAQRPQDLEDLVVHWIDRGELGSRLDWMTSSLDRRLQESQDRAEARPLAVARAREGVEKLAAALILTRKQNIRVPDGTHSGPGLNAREVLGWDELEITTLLQRSLFDLDIYGTVRFHHRSVLEYLAAQWFRGLLLQEVSRHKVEDLFFREQYGLQVVPPSLRPLLPWLAIDDHRILSRVRQVAPEIVFEGGDPKQFPASVRSEMLQQVCEQLQAGTSDLSMAQHSAALRFAAPDVSDTVRQLLRTHRDNEEVVSFLMRIVWQGHIRQALPETLDVARSSAMPEVARLAAFNAIDAIGTPAQMLELRVQFAQDSCPLSRRCMAELLRLVQEPDAATLQWIIDCIPRLAEFNEHHSSGLSREIAIFFERADVTLSALAIEPLWAFLVEPPVSERYRYCISVRYRWLRLTAGTVLTRLLRARNEVALRPSAIAALHALGQNDSYDLDAHDLEKLGLAQLVQEWPAVKWAWLWHNIEYQRAKVLEKGTQRVIDPWLAWASMPGVVWNGDDFVLALAALSERPLVDDRLVALDIAFRLYAQTERQPAHLQQIEFAVGSNEVLRAHLEQLQRPPGLDESLKQWERENEEWSQRSKARAEQEKSRRLKTVKQLAKQLDTLRDPGFDDPSAVSKPQSYLLEQMRSLEQDKGSRWTLGQWRSLQAEFGADTAQAFRDGIVAYWRRHTPQLISEGAQINSMPLANLFGLAGLTIEAAETPGLMSTLAPAEVRTAFCYAMWELNGFPHWFGDLCAAHQEDIAQMALVEVTFEVQARSAKFDGQYLIANIRHAGGWLANRLAPHILQLLAVHTSVHLKLLSYLVDVVLMSDVPDGKLATLASRMMVAVEPGHQPLWAAVWTSAEPDTAIDAVECHVQALSDDLQRTEFIMAFATRLLGSHSAASCMRTAFQTPAVLKRLYLLIHQYVRADTDIERVGKGVYSPELRDNAQDAREHLARMLRAIPGREAFLALQAIAEEHPQYSWRPWFVKQAVSKAQADSERPAWGVEQVNEFAKLYERAPANHRELFDLAVMRLLDLKHEMEDSDYSTASVVRKTEQETELRKWIAAWCSRHAHGRFVIPEEYELPDGKRPDMRWTCNRIEGAVPVELKIANKWPGPQLFERLESQLAGDYLRDNASNRGIYLLVLCEKSEKNWQISEKDYVNFELLIHALQTHWKSVAHTHPQVEEIKVIGIDLTKRKERPQAIISGS